MNTDDSAIDTPPSGRDDSPVASRVIQAILLVVMITIVQALLFSVVLLVSDATTGFGAQDFRNAAPSSIAHIYVLCAGEVLFAGAMLALARVIAPLQVRRGPRTPSVIRGVWMLAPVLAVFVVLPIIGALASGSSVISADLAWQAVPGIVMLAVAVGVAEEVAYRHIVFERLGGAASPWIAVIGSSVLFGALHVSSGSTFVLANAVAAMLAVGVPFAVVRVMSTPLRSLIVVHAVNDTFALLNLGGLDLSHHPARGELQFLVGAASVMAAVYLVMLYRYCARRRAV